MSETISYDINATEQHIINCLAAHRKATTAQVGAQIGYQPDALRPVLKSMENRKLIRRAGPGRPFQWELTSEQERLAGRGMPMSDVVPPISAPAGIAWADPMLQPHAWVPSWGVIGALCFGAMAIGAFATWMAIHSA